MKQRHDLVTAGDRRAVEQRPLAHFRRAGLVVAGERRTGQNRSHRQKRQEEARTYRSFEPGRRKSCHVASITRKSGGLAECRRRARISGWGVSSNYMTINGL